MIKSDKWIKKMCTQPPLVVTHRGKTFFSHMTLEEIEQHNASLGLTAGSDIGTHLSIQHRLPTEAELAQWKPLISDFIDNQVRQLERNGTEEEFQILKNMGAPYLQAHIGKSVQNLRVDPLLGLQVRQKIVSYGTSSFGYDVRLADEFKIFTNVNGGIIDPLNMNDQYYHEHKGDKCIIPPNSYVLGHTIERFAIPRDVMVICLGKSTYARCGAIVNVTPIEAGFEGQVVIEISNATNLPLVVHANQGIAQFMFFQSDEECEVSYADRGGKYQGQSGIQTALV